MPGAGRRGTRDSGDNQAPLPVNFFFFSLSGCDEQQEERGRLWFMSSNQ